MLRMTLGARQGASLVLTALLPGCLTVTTPSDLQGTGGGAGTSQQAVPRCDQTCQDDDVAYAIDNAAWLLYDQNVAGQPSGSLSKMASCPLSGTVTVTGTVNTASNGVTTTDLTFDLESCEVAASSYALTFTGTLHMSGTYTAMVQNDVTFNSSSLDIVGQLQVLDDPSVNETCAAALTDTWDHDPNDTTWLNGVVCGRSAGSGGSVGSSSGGAGGTSGSGGSTSTSSGGTGQSTSGGVTTCGNCPGQLECSTITGKCAVQSCACYYVVNGSDADSSWYLANGSCFMCQQNGLVTGDCTAAANAAAQVIVNCQ
jgi:hypothetical protein